MTNLDIDRLLQEVFNRCNWSMIPPHMHYGVKEWIEYGRPQGGFLMSMLKHDVYEAVLRADQDNKATISNWVEFMCWYLPADCHGPSHWKTWMDNGGLRGIVTPKVPQIKEEALTEEST